MVQCGCILLSAIAENVLIFLAISANVEMAKYHGLTGFLLAQK